MFLLQILQNTYVMYSATGWDGIELVGAGGRVPSSYRSLYTKQCDEMELNIVFVNIL